MLKQIKGKTGKLELMDISGQTEKNNLHAAHITKLISLL